jgi:hypothetical protein
LTLFVIPFRRFTRWTVWSTIRAAWSSGSMKHPFKSPSPRKGTGTVCYNERFNGSIYWWNIL